jgi:hypothetical protein
MDTKDIVAALFSAVTAFVAISNWRGARFRPKLKEDLAILKQLRAELAALGHDAESIRRNDQVLLLMKKIERKINRSYGTYGTDASDVVVALALASAGVFLLVHPEFSKSAWAGTAAVVSLVVAAYFAYEGFKNRGKPRED